MSPYQFKVVRVVFVACLLAFAGCSRHTIFHELEAPIPTGKGLSIGAIADRSLGGEHPAKEQIAYFKEQLAGQIEISGIFSGVLIGHNKPDYELTGSILEYDGHDSPRGIGLLGSLISEPGLYGVRATVSLTLKESRSGRTIFSGDFTNKVSGGFKADKTFRMVAKNFASSLKKAIEQEARYVD
jgi:hypothetical protein